MKTTNKLLVGLLSLFLLTSCKKQDLKEENQSVTASSFQHAKRWLEKQAPSPVYHKILLDGKTVKMPQQVLWEKTISFENEAAGITPVIVKSVNGDMPVHKFLLMEYDPAGNIRSANYYIVLADKTALNPVSLPEVTPAFLTSPTNGRNFKGAVLKYDLNDNLLSSRHYNPVFSATQTDKMVFRKNKGQAPVESTMPLDEGCSYVTVDWYWQTWENGVLVSEEYLFSSTVIYCEATGGGGSGGNGPTCEEQNEVFVNQGHAVNGPVHSGTEFYNGATWIKNYNWLIFQAGTWGLLSYERGTLEKIHYPNNQSRWEFQSFDHIKIAESGIVFGGTRTFQDLGATINITPTKMSAWVRIDFSVSSKVICFANPVTIPYNANKTFYAPNSVVVE